MKALSHGLGYLGRLNENFLQRPTPDASFKQATYIQFQALGRLGMKEKFSNVLQSIKSRDGLYFWRAACECRS